MTVLLLTAVATYACDNRRPSHDDLRLTIGTASGGVYYSLAKDLARIVTNAAPGLQISVVATNGSGNNIRAISQGLIDLTVTQSDVAYAFSQTRQEGASGEKTEAIRGISVLHASYIHVVALADSGLHDISDLRGRRVGMSSPAAGTQDAMRTLLHAHGIDVDHAISPQPAWADSARKLRARELDAVIFSAILPAPGLSDLAHTASLRLLQASGDAIDTIRRQYGFFRPVTIPADSYHGINYETSTVGVDNVLICRMSLPDDAVHTITKLVSDSMPSLSDTYSITQRILWANSPATPIPLHPGALRYYRERELLR